MLKNISENLLGQISGITGRFENQGQSIVKAANALETVNFKIDKTLQNRHADLSRTLEQLSGKASEFATFVEGYSNSIEGSLSEADIRARTELERMRATRPSESERTLEDLRDRLSSVSSAMTSELGTMTNRFASTSEEMRQHASRAATEIAAEQGRLREQMERLPIAAQESSESMRRALQDQIKALDQLSALTARTAAQRDVTQPLSADGPPPTPRGASGQETARSLTSLSSTIAQEMGDRQRAPAPARRRRSAPDGREGWSLGDLLARASRDEDGRRARRRRPNHIQSRPRGDSAGARYGDVGRDLDPAAGQDNAASWCARSTASRAARCSTMSPIAAAPSPSSGAPSAAISPTSSASSPNPISETPQATDAVAPRLRLGPRLPLPGARLRPHRLSAQPEPTPPPCRTVKPC